MRHVDHRRPGGEGVRITTTEKISIDSPALVKVAKGVDLVVGWVLVLGCWFRPFIGADSVCVFVVIDDDL